MDRADLDRLTTVIDTPRLLLTPTTVAHADELADVLRDPALHEFVGGSPRSAAEWSAVLDRWSSRQSPDGTEVWLNWVVELRSGGIVGWVQATVRDETASIAYTIGTDFHGHGYATEAAGAMLDHLLAAGIVEVRAGITPGHRASEAVVERLGFLPSEDLDRDGERIWFLSATPTERAPAEN